ncbi:MAG TPA: hypothetical protein VMR33_12135 [Candidatus Baltobacteraceae bacterium]|jgi:hypothetical protein|nr:hypothetical protein [Candidatus Baltobacteraceae bacterium]
MNTKLILGAAILVAGVATMQAQDANSQNGGYYSSSSWLDSSSDLLYRANEFSLDAFGAVASDARRHDGYYDYGYDHHRDVRGGGGGGLEYFFCRYVGIEAESFALANDRNTASAVGGNLVLRLPIGPTGFSPYIFGGGGNEWTDRTEGYADAGAGLEYRFTRSFGIFGDGRFALPSDTRNYGMGRFGVKFTF